MRDDDDDCCGHDDPDYDMVEGRAHCWRCGHSWTLTTAEMDRMAEWETEYHEAMAREDRRQWWRDIYYTLTVPLRPWRRWRARKYDDGIPF